jgi:hypothetical protein
MRRDHSKASYTDARIVRDERRTNDSKTMTCCGTLGSWHETLHSIREATVRGDAAAVHALNDRAFELLKEALGYLDEGRWCDLEDEQDQEQGQVDAVDDKDPVKGEKNADEAQDEKDEDSRMTISAVFERKGEQRIVGATTSSARPNARAMPPCRFFSSRSGCRHGDACQFSHGLAKQDARASKAFNNPKVREVQEEEGWSVVAGRQRARGPGTNQRAREVQEEEGWSVVAGRQRVRGPGTKSRREW